jgi:hypothetical protein
MKKKAIARIAVLATLSLLAIPSVASARPWGGQGFNDLGPAYLSLDAKNGKVKVKNVQLIMACTDAEDGTESSRAFYGRFLNYRALRLNKFDIEFTALAGGRIGLVHLKGILRSNGTGAARAEVIATATGDMGQVVERCQGAARIQLRRGPN